MKIKIWICVVILLLTFTFASCTKNELEEEWEPPKINETATAQAEKSQENEPESIGDLKVIDFIFLGYSNSGKPTNIELINNMTDTLNARLIDELGAEVKFHWVQYSAYESKVLEVISSNGGIDAVDAFYFGSSVFTTLLNNDLLMDISDAFKTNMPTTYEIAFKNFPDIDDYLLTRGAQYIIPSINAFPVRYYILTQKDIYREYGRKITTLEDYENYLEWLATNKPDLTVCYANPMDVIDAYLKGNSYISSEATTLYKYIDDREQTILPMEQIPEFSTAYEMLVRWKDKGYFDGISEPMFYFSSLVKGEVASILCDLNFQSMRKDLAKLPTNIEYEYIVLYPDTKMMCIPYFGGMTLLKRGDATEEAMMFYEWMNSSQDNYNLVQYGVEGENYNLIDEKLSISPESNQSIMEWWGSENFYNFNLERSIWSEPFVFSDFFAKIAFENTITYQQLNKELGISSTDIDFEDQEEITREYEEVISPLLEVRFDAFEKFAYMLYNYDFSMTIDEVIEMLNEANAQKIAQAYMNINELSK